MQEMSVRRTYKDRLFRLIFKEKEALLELYNAINNSNYKNPDDLEITTLEDVIYLSMKNDVSFLLGDVLNLWEHQSSLNPNMPLRGLFYFARLYRIYVEEHKLNIYGSSPKMVPRPQYVVFYNGREDEPDQIKLQLSDLYSRTKKSADGWQGEEPEPCLEVTALMLNINLGKNTALMKQCRILEEYSIFVAKVRENLSKDMDIETAVNLAINECIKQGILADRLSVNRMEVLELFLTEYDEQRHMEMEREENFAAGKAEGKTEGKVEFLCKLLEEKFEASMELKEKILVQQDSAVLDRWFQIALQVDSLKNFMEKTGLN